MLLGEIFKANLNLIYYDTDPPSSEGYLNLPPITTAARLNAFLRLGQPCTSFRSNRFDREEFFRAIRTWRRD